MKKRLEEFVIPFSGLKPGRYEYSFEVDDTFFEHFEQSEFTSGKLLVKVELQRQTTMLAFAFDIEGTVNLLCDRCGDPYDQPVKGSRRMVAHLGGAEPENLDDIIILSAHEHVLDVSQYVYEFITLLMPARRVHPDGECDPEVIRKLNELRSGDDGEGKVPSDPRWAALKGLAFETSDEDDEDEEE
jgi:uncharacterized metal-binding protein YceD (DUF177 family)